MAPDTLADLPVSEADASLPPVLPAYSVRDRNATRLGYLFAAVGAILFSTKAVIIKLAYADRTDAETLLALRMAFSLPFYFAIGIAAVHDRRRNGTALPSGRLALRATLIGALGYWLASYTDFLGLEYISAQFERLILFTYPLFVVLFGAAFFHHKIQPRALIAIAVSYSGIAVIFAENFAGGTRDILVGTGFVLVAAISFALYQLLAKEVIAAMGPRLFTCIAMTGAAIGAFLQFLAVHRLADLWVGTSLIAYSIVLAIGATVIPSFFLNAALHRISAQANGAIGTISPVVTLLLAAAILGERMTGVEIAGATLVLAGVGWFTLSAKN